MSLFEIRLRVPGASAPRLDVSIESDARALAIFGPSGAGKTTLIESVCGLRSEARGRIAIGGRVLLDERISVAAAERRIGWVPQDVLLFPHLNVRDNILSGVRSSEDETYRRALAALEIAELTERSVVTLSGGEQRRVALARALCSQPDLLVLDEPLAGLDRALQRRVLPYLLRLRQEFHVPLLLVTHEASEVHALCDQVVRLEGGLAIQQGPPEEVLSAAELRARDFENLVQGRVSPETSGGGTMRVLVGESSSIVAPSLRTSREPQTGDAVLLGIRADEILIATQRPEGISARNVLKSRVGEVREEEGVVYLRAYLDPGGPDLTVSLTEEARRELRLTLGKEIFLILKTQSCRVMRAD